jgi:hypothetical protein
MNYKFLKAPGDLLQWDYRISNPVIFLMNLERIPPHIAMVFHNRYYSYDLVKFDTGSPIEKILRYCQQKSEKILACVLIKHPVFSTEYMEQIVALWRLPDKTGNNSVTCLDPVLDFLKEFYLMTWNVRPTIPELIHHLTAQNMIERKIFINFMEKEPVVELKNYSEDFLKEFTQAYVSER